jgi:iron(III) transport system ATP-binding protein
MPKGTPVRFHVRPEEIKLLETLDRSDNSFYAHVLKTEYLGAYSLFTLQPEGCRDVELVAQYATNYLNGWRIVPGATLRLGIPSDAIRPIADTR